MKKVVLALSLVILGISVVSSVAACGRDCCGCGDKPERERPERNK